MIWTIYKHVEMKGNFHENYDITIGRLNCPLYKSIILSTKIFLILKNIC